MGEEGRGDEGLGRVAGGTARAESLGSARIIASGRRRGMAVHDLSRKLSYDDYASIPEDGQRHEILDGEHYVSPAPLVPHQEISSNLHTELGPFIKKHRLGKLLADPTNVILSPHDVVQPDFLFISNQRSGIITRENVQGAPAPIRSLPPTALGMIALVRSRKGSQMLYKLPLLLAPQPEGGFTVTSPLLPELVTEGDTVSEALANVQDALAAVIETYQDLGRPLPASSRLPDEDSPVWLETLIVA
jgi:antitoxin HicB